MVVELLPDASAEWSTLGIGASVEVLLQPPPASQGSQELQVCGVAGATPLIERPFVSCLVTHAEWNRGFPGVAVGGRLALLDSKTESCTPGRPVVLLRRGGATGDESFVDLVSHARTRVPETGLVVIANDGRSMLPTLMCVGGVVPAVPAVLISECDGDLLWGALESGGCFDVQVTCPGVAEHPDYPKAPRAIAVAPAGDVFYVADIRAHCVWRCRRDESPSVLAGIPGTRAGDAWRSKGMATAVALDHPHDLAISPDGRILYICELYSIRAVDLERGPPELSTVMHTDFGLGGVCSRGSSHLLVAEHSQHRIIEIDLASEPQMPASSSVKHVAGTGEPGPLRSDVPATHARLNNPTKMVVIPTGDLVFIDAGNRALRLVDAATGRIHTLSDAIDAPDGLAVGPCTLTPTGYEFTLLVAEARARQVLQFRVEGRHANTALCHIEWCWSACLGTGDNAEPFCDASSLALSTPVWKPQGLAWLGGSGMLVCDAQRRAVLLAHSVTPWVWRGHVVLLRSLVEQGRANLMSVQKGNEEAGDFESRLHDALLILMRLPDEEFREVLSWLWV